MKDLLHLAEKKYENALETIAYLKEALYFFMNFDPKKPEECGNKIYEMAHYGSGCFEEVNYDRNNFTPGQTFLRNGCKDTQVTFGTSIESKELEDFEKEKE